ncbi:MAG: acid phosphatase, partial [Actinobacteria bacterium]|nr:acid phosphatase [Actinomycetota bacterium]
NDSCPHSLSAPNLGANLIAAHLTFAGYSQDLPATGSPVCDAGQYARKHVPWTDFTNVPPADSQQFSEFGAGGYARLPTVSFVIPNLCADMHNCSVAAGDTWLREHISGYVAWAMSHRSLLILTWDEGSGNNHIVTIFAGQQVKPGRYPQPLTHFGVLRTIEDAYRLPHDGAAATATPVTGVWK